MCRIGFYFPDTESTNKFFNGTTIEEEYAKRLEASIMELDGKLIQWTCSEVDSMVST